MNYDIAQSEANETKAPECQNTHFDSFLEIGVSTVISVIWNRMEQDSMLILFQHWQVSIRIKEAVLLKPFEQKETPSAKFDSTDSTDVPWQIWARTRRAPKDPRIQKGFFWNTEESWQGILYTWQFRQGFPLFFQEDHPRITQQQADKPCRVNEWIFMPLSRRNMFPRYIRVFLANYNDTLLVPSCTPFQIFLKSSAMRGRAAGCKGGRLSSCMQDNVRLCSFYFPDYQCIWFR